MTGQILNEKLPPNHIATILFQAQDEMDNIPMVALGKAFTLYFDDLNGDESYYYYTIQHADADWTASKSSNRSTSMGLTMCVFET